MIIKLYSINEMCYFFRVAFLIVYRFKYIYYNFLFPEFQKIAMATAIGFAIMGFIGFFVKLIHIPINNIIV